ncbi:winged helix DNA-binding domain-containing protein [Paenibacillus harenae]|uniref:Winged helix DNA-binding domain-containing protein n=1 Tax=Paenibacillus harenae TaxID=306543 RepID=A0ABT9UA83_PAEHA|nr:winged helix DNA-binding domain-containing protein [Paenibacillus harenae]MDQ0115089.1 hypothetical protein [Paenibacillus harenae]
MSIRTLSKRELNRALLARQMLLQRERISPLEAIRRLVAIQAQAQEPPYYALWTRLENFKQEQLSQLLLDREVVRIVLHRSTIHLVTAQDCLSIRTILKPMLESSLHRAIRSGLTDAEREELLSRARALTEEKPRTLDELGKLLAEKLPGYDKADLANAARNLLPLVQVTPRGVWGAGGQACHTTAEAWLGKPLETDAAPDDMLRRYLAAYGPASIKDMQVWSGMSKLKETIERLRPTLRTFRDERGVELFDVPDAPLPDGHAPAPPRFLSEFDNMLLSYADRSRIMDEKHKPLVFTINGIIRSTFLIDGFVRGLWKLEQRKGEAILGIQPFEPLATEAERAALIQEGEKLLEFATGAECRHTILFL